MCWVVFLISPSMWQFVLWLAQNFVVLLRTYGSTLWMVWSPFGNFYSGFFMLDIDIFCGISPIFSLVLVSTIVSDGYWNCCTTRKGCSQYLLMIWDAVCLWLGLRKTHCIIRSVLWKFEVKFSPVVFAFSLRGFPHKYWCSCACGCWFNSSIYYYCVPLVIYSKGKK